MSRRDHDEYEYEDESTPPRVMRVASWLAAVAALGAFGFLAWFAYHSGGTNDPAQAELVTAEATPYKEVPKDPGGWQAPHRDKSIYNVMDGRNKQPQTAERLTPAPEEPVDVGGSSTWMNAKLRDGQAEVPLTDAERQKADAPKEAPKPEAPKQEKLTPDTPPAPVKAEAPKEEAKPAAPTPAPVVKATETPPAPQSVAEAPKAETPKAEPAPEQKTAAPAKPTTTGSARIQLGAFRTPAEAAQHLKTLGRKVPGILTGHTTKTEHADLGAKGIYYRLFAQGYATRADAVADCAKIKAAKLDCIVK